MPVESDSVVAAWIDSLKRTLRDEQFVIDVRVGVFYTAVQISSGNVGAAFTPRDLNDTVCCPKTAAEGPPVGRMIGHKAWELAGYAHSPVALRRSIGIATLNALSALAIDRYGVPNEILTPGLDALVAAEVKHEDSVAMVGAFIPFIKALKGKVAELRIVDKHPEALKPDEQSFWISPERATEALARANVIIISGSALVEGGIDELILAAHHARTVALAGPTAPLWPVPFFERGINVLAGIRVRDGAGFLTGVTQGGSGYFFFEGAAEKVCVTRLQPASGKLAQAPGTPQPYRPLGQREFSA